MDDRHIARITLTLIALTSCQSYEPRPLEPATHRAAWHARTLEDASLREFVDRLDVDLGGEPAVFDPADGLTLRETGERMGRSREAMKKLYGRAICRLKATFEEMGRAGSN